MLIDPFAQLALTQLAKLQKANKQAARLAYLHKGKRPSRDWRYRRKVRRKIARESRRRNRRRE